jgi:hypothetical protein
MFEELVPWLMISLVASPVGVWEFMQEFCSFLEARRKEERVQPPQGGAAVTAGRLKRAIFVTRTAGRGLRGGGLTSKSGTQV